MGYAGTCLGITALNWSPIAGSTGMDLSDDPHGLFDAPDVIDCREL